MRYLLDVNALVALGYFDHEFHTRVSGWVRKLASSPEPELATCSITELGFVRVLTQATQYGFSISQSCRLLQQLKRAENPKFFFIPDDHDVSHIPAWVKTAKQTTDGHLAQLAKAKGAILATLDEGIPGSFAIPAGS
jgi:predicted nucleic acid-binding protein